jgi:dTMP kinase
VTADAEPSVSIKTFVRRIAGGPPRLLNPPGALPRCVRPGLVTFEGIDGSGKTTVSRRVFEILRDRGGPVAWTSEPTHHWLGEAVRRSYQEDVGPLAEAFLFLADRATHVAEIRSLVSAGHLVLCDRYADSTYAYQGARLQGIVPRPVEFLQAATEPWFAKPKLTILLEVPVALALSRIADRPEKIRFEDRSLLERVAKNYHRLARSQRYAIVDATRSIDRVVDDCIGAIEKRLGHPAPRHGAARARAR